MLRSQKFPLAIFSFGFLCASCSTTQTGDLSNGWNSSGGTLIGLGPHYEPIHRQATTNFLLFDSQGKHTSSISGSSVYGDKHWPGINLPIFNTVIPRFSMVKKLEPLISQIHSPRETPYRPTGVIIAPCSSMIQT